MTDDKAPRTPHEIPPPHERQVQDWLVGRVLGKYKLIKPIGFGSFANIYEAVHVHLRVPFAIKILHPAFISHEEVVKRFFREGQAASQLQHENVVFIADFDVEDDVGPYIVMEYLEGTTLKTHLERNGALALEEVGEVSRQICQALALAHSKGIIHRDLKPENIFLVPRGAGRSLVKILDFGIAHLADCGESITGARLLGTPVYMAPEQFRGETHSTSLDIYSFGVLLYEMLTGTPPFKGQNVQQLGIEHLLIPAPPLEESFPEKLRELQAILLSKSPSDRPGSMEEVWSRLAPALDPNQAFTHWHQQAIDPITAAKILNGKSIEIKPPDGAGQSPTDTVIEKLDDYTFQETAAQYQSQAQADTAKDASPSVIIEDESDVLVRDLPTSKQAPPKLSPRPNGAHLEASSSTQDDGIHDISTLPPLDPIDAPNTTVTPLGKDGLPQGLSTSIAATHTPPHGHGSGSFPPLRAGAGTGGHYPPMTPHVRHQPRAVPPASLGPPPSRPQGDPYQQSRGGAISGSPQTDSQPIFGRMGDQEKRLLMIVWVGVLIVVISVLSLIIGSIDRHPPSPREKAPQKRTQASPKSAQPSLVKEPTITIKTTPPGADVYIGGQPMGTTPYQITRPMGTLLQLRLVKSGYRTRNEEHRVKQTESYDLSYQLNP